jgi:Uma2 family endonuclease
METVKSLPEQRVTLHGVSWETYERLLADHPDSSAPRFVYGRGTLEIMSPSPEHEDINRTLARLIEAIAEELDMNLRDLGSTTFKREDLERGFEPGSCFYIRNEGRIRGKREIDLAVDPPPDLVIEVYITSPSLNKLPIYAGLGVPEVWRCDGRRVSILVLANGEYVERDAGEAFPSLTSEVLSRFVDAGRNLGRVEWLRKVRGWAREWIGELSGEPVLPGFVLDLVNVREAAL